MWQGLYPPHQAEKVRDEIMSCYGEVAVAKIAHSEQLKSLLPARDVEDKLRSDEALTMALLGLFAEEALLNSRLPARLGRKRTA